MHFIGHDTNRRHPGAKLQDLVLATTTVRARRDEILRLARRVSGEVRSDDRAASSEM
jgi:hypothetical protein